MVICVYKITCLNPDINWSYVGSTKNYNKRKIQHKTYCYNKKSYSYNKKAYCFIRENGGFDNFQFDIIEKFEKYDKMKLCERELYYIDKTWDNNCNQNRPFTKYDNEKNRKNKYAKKYRENNREILLQKNKEYNKNNKEIISQKYKEYYENNKELISLKHKVKINCNFCNRLIGKYNMKRHQKTKYCLNIQSKKEACIGSSGT
tara:strand:+ start:38 stop:646 length:609 start_codon:yes stop_codon:yes gene_type:complete